jgi:hypothetical protein
MKQRLSMLGFLLSVAVLAGTLLACKRSATEGQGTPQGQAEQGYGTQQSTAMAPGGMPGTMQPGTTQPGSTGTPAPGAGR